MTKLEIPEVIDNISNYLKTTSANGLLLHTSEQPSPYSDLDFYLVFSDIRERKRFVRKGKEHAYKISNLMPARLVLNCTTPNGVFSIFKHQDEAVKVDINTETTRSIQRSSAILGSRVIFDDTGRLQEYVGAARDDIIKKNFHTPSRELQSILDQYYGFNWNALSKIWKGDYKLVAFELIPIYLKMTAALEHACNDRASVNFFNSEGNMRPETNKRFDEIEIRPQRGALIATLEKLQALFHDLGVEVADKYHLVYPEEAENLFVHELRSL